jgi:glutamate/tyrosine decarboxylase-like PLP-dependent enzyme
MTRLLEDLGELVSLHFEDNLECALVFGSVARDECSPESDIDLLVVLKNRKAATAEIEHFKESFIGFQTKHGFVPDITFPGEYCSKWDIEKSLRGSGFIHEAGRVLIDRIYSSDWNAVNEYRQWLSALSGPSVCVAGDRSLYHAWRRDAIQSSLLLHLLAADAPIFEEQTLVDELLEGGKEYLGYVDTPNTRIFLEREVPGALAALEREGIVNGVPDADIKVFREAGLKRLSYIEDVDTYRLRTKFLGSAAASDDIEVLHAALDAGYEFLSDDAAPVVAFRAESDIRDQFLSPMPTEPMDLRDVVKEYETKIMQGSIRQGSKSYLAFPDAGNATSAVLGGILEVCTNQNLIATTKSAPTGTFAEIQVVRWLRSLVGYDNSQEFPSSALEVGGIAVGGGTMANAIAILAARTKVFPESRSKGLQVITTRPILLVAGETFYHYSHIASFWWLGMGEENVVFLKTLDNYRIDPADLEEKLSLYNSSESRVVAVVCQAGDSRTTTIENFEEIHRVTSRHNVWLHVDACHGGVLLFSEKLRHKLRGINLADSISIDPHKGLCIPYASSLLLFKDVESMSLLGKSTDITIRKGSYDIGQVTPFIGSKPFDSLKLWFLIKNLGLKGISSLVEYRHGLAEAWSAAIESSAFFTVLNTVELNSVVFSVSPEKLAKAYPHIPTNQTVISELNTTIHDVTYQQGEVCIHTFDIVDVRERVCKGKQKLRVLGVTLGNPNTSESDFPEYISGLEERVREFAKSWPY